MARVAKVTAFEDRRRANMFFPKRKEITVPLPEDEEGEELLKKLEADPVLQVSVEEAEDEPDL